MNPGANGWGAPCSGSRTVLVRADGLRLPVRRELADLIGLLVDLSEAAHGYDVRPGQTWGYACRKIAGSSSWSGHAWATAVDLNAPSNPHASADWHRRNARGTFPFGLRLVCDHPEGMVALWEGHGFRWGGRYSRPDPMHYEFTGTPADAARIAGRLRTFLAAAGTPAPPTPAPLAEEFPMDVVDLSGVTADPRSFVRGRHVRRLQALLLASWEEVEAVRPFLAGMVNGYGLPDGVAGPATRACLAAWQQANGLAADAIAGPASWRRLIVS